jgi:Skp family chaperone for outer membrane proteins
VQDELGALSREISGIQAELASKQGVANDAALGDLNRKLVEKQRVFEDKQRRGKRDFEERQDVILKDLGTKLNEVITRYADENRYTAVFILKPNELIYLAKTSEITDTVIKLYNERYPYQQAK